MTKQMQLHRSQDKVIAGVCAGLAEHFDMPVTKVRIAYVALSVLSAGFPGVLVYLILWYLLPEG